MSNHETEEESHTLFVGEGDFSFSANYIVKSKGYHEKVYASCLTDQPFTDRQLMNMNTIIENGGFIFTDVDATQLEFHPEIKDVQFSKIIFNFPHISRKMNIHRNRLLVKHFFLSSKRILKPNGMIQVTLCQGQGGTDIEKVKRKWSDTWQIVSLAASASFILHKIQPFKAHEFDTYQCTGFRGLQKPFITDGALTHMFALGSPVCLNEDITKSYLDVALYLKNIEDLIRNVYHNLHHPSEEVSSILNNVAQKIFTSIHKEIVCDIITCMRQPSVNFDIDCCGTDFCDDCMRYLISLGLQKRKSGCISSVKCVVCCVKNICIDSFPFYYLQVYFGDNISNMLTHLPSFLINLKQIYARNTCNSESPHDHDCLKDGKRVHLVSPDYDIKSMSVRSILNLYATYSKYQGEQYFFYTDIDFFLLKNNDTNEIKSGIFKKIGSLLQINDGMSNYFCLLFDINLLSCIKYHIMDYRTLFSESSFYDLQVMNNDSVNLYRPLSLYPPIFAHDVSFYVNQNFNENDLFLVIRNAVGYLIKSVSLIDVYYNNDLKKYSRCYRFTYQSCDQVLSKSIADHIHFKFMRKVLENSLNISLR